ncbi:MAG TPA: VTT domain-containing protein [Blastocatellia bacterium]|nr:VTT domain-containing protein [Blastocatellia bacterium]HMV86512.1 VTT domain-containing protein [Blastocatellia bacterium]HMX27492.1 VTT domain-containing protein [Blastocatellia bacterium]HMY74331.1 VTT domain-containing protein [Blastocatellia bacterium]HMZ19931.1 VTT domain-containing protein [Blastocatellia bacterium]
MKTFLLGIGSTMKSLQAMLIGFGALGILAIGFMDAAFIPLPGGPDVVVMALSHHNHTMMPVYVFAAVAGSTIGSLVLYFAALKSGQTVLRKFSPEKRARVEDLLERYDILAMLLASVLPPPFPFKLFVLSAGAFKMQLWRFVAALVVGRGFRFLLEGILAVKYGEQATDIFKHNYPKIGLGVAAAILVIYLFNSLLKRRRREATS